MKTVRVTMSDEAYAVFRKQAKGKFPGIASLMLDKLGFPSDDALAADITKAAISRAKQHEVNQLFRLKDLFTKTEWESYSVGVRRRTGRQFHALVSSNKHPTLLSRGKDDANHQRYKRIP